MSSDAMVKNVSPQQRTELLNRIGKFKKEEGPLIAERQKAMDALMKKVGALRDVDYGSKEMTGKLLPDAVKNLKMVKEFRTSNAGKTFDVGKEDTDNFVKSAKLDSNKPLGDQLKQLMDHAWNNDGKGSNFFSMKEFGNIYNWGKQNYKDQNQFQKDFVDKFKESAGKTQFTKDLLLQQMTNASGSSTFNDNGANKLFEKTMMSMADDVAKMRGGAGDGAGLGQGKAGAADGTMLASYDGSKENKSYDKVAISMKDGKAELARTDAADGSGKMVYDLGNGETDGLKNGAGLGGDAKLKGERAGGGGEERELKGDPNERAKAEAEVDEAEKNLTVADDKLKNNKDLTDVEEGRLRSVGTTGSLSGSLSPSLSTGIRRDDKN